MQSASLPTQPHLGFIQIRFTAFLRASAQRLALVVVGRVGIRFTDRINFGRRQCLGRGQYPKSIARFVSRRDDEQSDLRATPATDTEAAFYSGSCYLLKCFIRELDCFHYLSWVSASATLIAV